MSYRQIVLGEIEPLKVFVVNSSGDPLTGKTDIYVRVQRSSDNWFLDWNDATFKASGHTTLNKILTEVDATNAAGLYEVTGGFASSAITNLAASDDLNVIPLQTPGTDAVLPSPAELQVRSSETGTIHVDATNGTATGSGLPADPVLTIDQAVALAAAAGTRKIKLAAGDYVRTGDLEGYEVEGAGMLLTSLDLTGSLLSINGTSLRDLWLKQFSNNSAGSKIHALRCQIEGCYYISGTLEDCRVESSHRAMGEWILRNCTGSAITISLNGQTVRLEKFTGSGGTGSSIAFSDGGDDYGILYAGVLSGIFRILSTTGSFYFDGVGEVWNESSGSPTVEDRTIGPRLGALEGLHVDPARYSFTLSDGSLDRPYPTVSDALDAAVEKNISKIIIHNLFTTIQGETERTIGDPTTEPMQFEGRGGRVIDNPYAGGVLVASSNFRESEVRNLRFVLANVTRDLTGVAFYDSTLEVSSPSSGLEIDWGDQFDEVEGAFHRCRFLGESYELRAGSQNEFVDCGAGPSPNGVAANQPVFSYTNGNSQTVWHRWSGPMHIINMADAASSADISLDGGVVTIHSSCTAGTITVSGVGRVDDNSGAGCTVVDETVDAYSGEAVFIDATVGDDANPGTPKLPCKTMEGGKVRAVAKNRSTLSFVGSSGGAFFTAGSDYTGFRFIGANRESYAIDLGGRTFGSCTFESLYLWGTMVAQALKANTAINCYLNDVAWAGTCIGCEISRGIVFGGDVSSKLIKCVSSGPEGAPWETIVRAALPTPTDKLVVQDYRGVATLADVANAAALVDWVHDGGKLTIDSSCTAGTIRVYGSCELVDNSGPGCTVIDNTGLSAIGDIKSQVDKIDLAPTVGPAAATTGSLLDRVANKDVSKTYNQATDSLEALKDKIG